MGVIATSACWGVVAILLTRGLPRYVVYSFSCTVLLFGLYNPTWIVAFTWPVLVGSSCIALGEAIRHHREQTDANENECSFQLCASRLPSYSISINEA